MTRLLKITLVVILFFIITNIPVEGQVIIDSNELENCYCDSSINNLKLNTDLSLFLDNMQFDGSKQIESKCKTYLESHNIDLTLYRSKFTFENKILIAFEFGYIYP